MLLLYLNQQTVAYLHGIAIINKIWIFFAVSKTLSAINLNARFVEQVIL